VPSRLHRALLAVSGALVLGVGAVGAVSAAPADPAPNVRVEINAPRHILPVDFGGTAIRTVVRNTGTAPAADVRVVISIPFELQVSSWSTSDEWDCSAPPVVPTVLTCDHVGDLAAGAEAYEVGVSAHTREAKVGQTVSPRAEVTTSSADSDSADNAASVPVSFVGTGVVKGRIWHDTNANGIQDAGEPDGGSIGIGIHSLDDDDLYGYANTSEGSYWVQAPAKRYYADVQVWLADWRLTTPNAGTDDTVDSDVTATHSSGGYQHGRTAEFVVTADGETSIDVGVVAAQQ